MLCFQEVGGRGGLGPTEWRDEAITIPLFHVNSIAFCFLVQRGVAMGPYASAVAA